MMTIGFEDRGGKTVAVVAGPMTAETSDLFREQFNAWLQEVSGTPALVVDLAKVEVMDSSGLGALLGALRRIAEKGGDMRLAALQPKPRLVFEITRAYKAFDIFDRVDEAL
jgi:anti-sigma B factor antagonist